MTRRHVASGPAFITRFRVAHWQSVKCRAKCRLMPRMRSATDRSFVHGLHRRRAQGDCGSQGLTGRMWGPNLLKRFQPLHGRRSC